MEYSCIFVAVDGSKAAELALKKAISISKRNNYAKIHLVHVIDKSTRAHLAEAVDQLYIRELEEFADKLLEKYKVKLVDEHIPYELLCLEGSPKHELINIFKTLKEDDLVICGATGINSSVERMLFGSISDHIVRQSNCDVLVVRTQEYHSKVTV